MKRFCRGEFLCNQQYEISDFIFEYLKSISIFHVRKTKETGFNPVSFDLNNILYDLLFW